MSATKYFIFIFAFTLITLFSLPGIVSAGSLDNISGWAWGGIPVTDPVYGYVSGTGGIGWISFNSTNCALANGINPCTGGSQASPDYGVNEDSVTNELTGYAWSSNFGWIKFGGLSTVPSAFPSGSGTQAVDAVVQGSKLVGWARACAGTATGDCSTSASRTDGWDGWISLSGKAADGSDYGVTVTNGNFSGYAWGGPVVGWISFNPYVGGQGNTALGCNGPNNCSVTGTTTPPLSGFTLDCAGKNSATIAPNGSVPLTVNSSNYGGSGSITINAPNVPSGTTVMYSLDGTNYYSLSDINSDYNQGSFSCYYSNRTYSCYTYPYSNNGGAELSMEFSPALPTNQTYTMTLDAHDYSDSTIASQCTVNIYTAPGGGAGGPAQFKEF